METVIRAIPASKTATNRLVLGLVVSLAITTAGPTAVGAEVAPDLVIQRIELMDCKPRVGVTVYNQSSIPVASPFEVRLMTLESGSVKPSRTADSTVGGLGAFSSTRVVFDLPLSDVLTATVDPARVTHESNTGNNTSSVESTALPRCPTVSVSGSRARKGGVVRFLIRIDHPFNQPVTVGYVTEDRTAHGIDFGLVASGTIACNADYIRARGIVEFPAGTTELARPVNIATCTDSSPEGFETFVLRLENLTNTQLANISGAGIAEGRIDDAPR